MSKFFQRHGGIIRAGRLFAYRAERWTLFEYTAALSGFGDTAIDYRIMAGAALRIGRLGIGLAAKVGS